MKRPTQLLKNAETRPARRTRDDGSGSISNPSLQGNRTMEIWSGERRSLLLEGSLEEGFAVDVVERFDHLELAVGHRLTDVDILGEVVILL